MNNIWCKFCSNKIEKSVIKISENITKKQFGDHEHVGNAIYRYGICGKQHQTKLEMVRVQWKQCLTCEKKRETLEKRRKYLEIKARIQKREIPSFLRDELDRFISKMETRLIQKIEQELQKRIKQEVFNQLEIILESRANIPSPPSLPSGLSPPSAPSDDDSDYVSSTMSPMSCSTIPAGPPE